MRNLPYLRRMKPNTRRRPRSSGRTADRCVPSAWFCATDVRMPCRCCCCCPAVVWRRLTWRIAGAAGAAVCVAACPTIWWSLRGLLISCFSCRAAVWSRCSVGPSTRPYDWHCLKSRKLHYHKLGQFSNLLH